MSDFRQQLKDAARDFAQRGFLVLTVKREADGSPAKRSFDKWNKDEFPGPTTLDQVDYDMSYFNRCGLWVRMSDEWCVIDHDTDESIEYWTERLGDAMHKVVISQPPNGRPHWWIKLPKGAEGVFNWSAPPKNTLGLRFDIRGQRRGGVMAPPSEHHKGGNRGWVGGHDLDTAVEFTLEEAARVAHHRLPGAAEFSGKERVPLGSPRAPKYDNGMGTKYGLAALEGELQRMRDARAESGVFNNAVNASCFSLGQLVGGGELAHEYTYDEITNLLDHYDSDADHYVTRNSGYFDGFDRPRSSADRSRNTHRIQLIDGAQLINDLADAVNDGAIPDLYTASGTLVLVADIYGDPNLPVGQVRKGTQFVDSHVLGAQMARHVEVYVVKEVADKPPQETRKQPYQDALRQVLARKSWSKVPPLRGITRVPVLRSDGSILNNPGYDPASGLYYDPRHDFSDLPTDPSQAEIEEARTFLLDQLIADFPFATESDRANYVALLATPPLRRLINGTEGIQPTPLGVINAHTAGTGKTLLADIIRESYGGAKTDFVDDENELRKVITSLLRDANGAVSLLDNVGSGHQIRSAVLASLLTSGTWTSRILGQSQSIALANDQLWITTGNNLRLGGDIASRTLLVSVDSGVERPDLRGNFTIPNLDTWIMSSENQAKIVRCMLILGRGWVAAGAPKIETRMRGFSTWASAMAGFLHFHKIPGFLENADKAFEADTEREQWMAFLGMWQEKLKDKWVGVSELIRSGHHGWGDAFLLIDVSTGKDLSVVKAGNRLREKVGVPLGGLVLQSEKPGGTNSKKSKVYRVVPHQKPESGTGGV